MKQLKTILCSLPFVFAAVGCSQDELTDAATGGNGGQARQVEITFHMGADAEVQTRSAVQRPVVSSDGWQRVTDVRIYAFVSEMGGGDDNYRFAPEVFNDNGSGKDYFYVSDFAETKKDWGDDDVWGDKKGQDETMEADDEEYTVPVKAELQIGKHYKFLAIGRDDIGEDGSTSANKEDALRGTWSIPKWSAETTLDKASLTCTGGIACSEMFSGCSKDIYIEKYGKYSATIDLKRIVAGVMMYLTNIPNVIKGEEVYRVSICPIQYIEEVLVAQDMTTGDGISAGKPGHGKPEGAYTQNMGKNYPFDKEYASIDVRDGSSMRKDEIVKNGSYLNAKTGKLLAGNFVLPQANSPLTAIGEDKDLDKSLYLVFWTAASSQEITSLKSTGAENEGLVNKERGDYKPIYEIPIKITGMNGLQNKYKYPILGNHFYSLGLYNEETGKNEPIDLKEHDFKKGAKNIAPTLHVTTPEEVWKSTH